MNDRELLELAAKAAGKLIVGDAGDDVLICRNDEWSRYFWNPLTDDGDALRLAVKLMLTVYQWPDEVCVCNKSGTINEDVARVGNIYAATRRAIVRAAAEIGRQMQEGGAA